MHVWLFYWSGLRNDKMMYEKWWVPLGVTEEVAADVL